MYSDRQSEREAGGDGGELLKQANTLKIPQIVIDTSALIAGLRSRNGSAFQMLSRVGTGAFDIHLSVPLVLEYEAVLLREASRLHLSKSAIEAVLDFHCSIATLHQIFFLWRPHLKDPGDDMVLELALKASADYIVTYNTRDFVGAERLGIAVIEPLKLLDRIGGVR